MKFLEDIHGVEIINMQDYLQDIVGQECRRILIVDMRCFLGDVDIDFFIIRQGQQHPGLEDVGFMEHILIDGVAFKDDHASLAHITDAAVFGIWLDHYDVGLFPFLLQVIQDQQFRFFTQAADDDMVFPETYPEQDIVLVEWFPECDKNTSGGQ